MVVQDAAARARLSRMNAAVMGSTADPMYGAPTILVVLADAHNYNAVPDGSLVMGNLMNAAASLGLGSCWINRAREEFETEEGKALLKEWGIEGDYIGIGHCILGYPCRGSPACCPPQAGLYRLCMIAQKERYETGLQAGRKGQIHPHERRPCQ